MKHALLALALSATTVGGCVNNNEPATQQPQPSAPLETNAELAAQLVGDWQQDLDASTDDQLVFVPGELDLGPARFRARFSLAADGSATVLVLSPNDGHVDVPGTWSLAAQTLTLAYTSPTDAGEVVDVYEVISAAADSLVLSRP